MTGQEFTSYVRALTKTNATTFTNAEILAFANVEQSFLAEQIASNVDEGYFNAILERSLEEGVRNYTFPEEFLTNMRYCSAVIGGDWTYLQETDFGKLQGKSQLLEEAEIVNEWGMKPAQYLIQGGELWLLSGTPIIAVPNGLKIISEIYPESLTNDDLTSASSLSTPSSNVTVRLPRSAYRVLAKKVSIAFKSSKDKPLPLTEDERRLDVDLRDLYDVLRGRNGVRVITASVPYNDGSQY